MTAKEQRSTETDVLNQWETWHGYKVQLRIVRSDMVK